MRASGDQAVARLRRAIPRVVLVEEIYNVEGLTLADAGSGPDVLLIPRGSRHASVEPAITRHIGGEKDGQPTLTPSQGLFGLHRRVAQIGVGRSSYAR